jgi:predicted dehydrogenase
MDEMDGMDGMDAPRAESTLTRRRFLQTGAAGAAGLALWPARRVSAARVGPNDTVRLALIGCGGMGRAHAYSLAYQDGCELAAICDVYIPRFEEVVKNVTTIYRDQRGMKDRKPEGYQDFRRILDRDDIDAVLIATPDHWHPLITIMACQAGKDVYVEKPVSTTVQEGRAMVGAARRYARVVQVGTQQRSMPVFHEAMKILHSGVLGHITTATAWIGTNYIAETMTTAPVPEGLDWDLWLGPAPDVPYSPERFGAFRGWHDYARGGELTNWGVHLVDILHWGIGEDAPLGVQAVGGNYIAGGGADNYEVVDALFEYPGCTLTWEQRHTNEHAGLGYGMKFQGPRGQLYCDRGRLIVEPEKLGIGEMMFPPEVTWANPDHHQNFFDCVRTRRRPAADIEQGHRSTTPTLLAGIALDCRRTLQWDRKSESFPNDPQANRHLSRPYRAPWHL